MTYSKRYRITFSKTSDMRFTSHLDTHHAWERTLRRAQVPLVYSQGFNPRPRISLGTALPLGCTSECELVDIWLEEECSPEDLLQDLRRVAPLGLHIKAVERVEKRQPSLQTQVIAVEYEVYIDPAPILEELCSSVQTLLDAETLPRQRRGKDYDLRPLIEAIEVIQDNVEGPQLRMRLAAREGATGRPEEVLLALNLDPTLTRSHRTRVILMHRQP